MYYLYKKQVKKIKENYLKQNNKNKNSIFNIYSTTSEFIGNTNDDDVLITVWLSFFFLQLQGKIVKMNSKYLYQPYAKCFNFSCHYENNETERCNLENSFKHLQNKERENKNNEVLHILACRYFF